MEVCPLGVDPEVFRPRRAAPGASFAFSSVGRPGSRAKGQAILLAAMAILAGRDAAFMPILVGDGPDRQRLEREVDRLDIARNVTFHGSVNQDRVLELLATADAFVLPSFAKGFPSA